MSKVRWLASATAVALLAGGAIPCIKALTLNEMVAQTDTAVRGTITDVRTTKFVPEDGARLIYTILTIEGENLYSGEDAVLEAAFVGGTYQGDVMNVTSAPNPADYRLGNKVLAFGGRVEGWGPEISRALWASYGGIYREVSTPSGPVFLGKGEGFAIEKNIRLADLRTRIAAAKEAR